MVAVVVALAPLDRFMMGATVFLLRLQVQRSLAAAVAGAGVEQAAG